MLTDLSALFIDVGGTMIHARRGVGAAYSEIAAALGLQVSAAALNQRFGQVFAEERDAARAATSLAYGRTAEEARRFWRRVVHEVFRPWSAAPRLLDPLFDALYDHFAHREAWSIFPDVVPLLLAARQRELPVIAVSNWDARLPLVLAAVELTPLLTAVVGSYAVGAEKPDPRIFETALALLPAGCERQRVLHVGDSLVDDVGGAEAVGLRALYLARQGAEGAAATGGITTLAALHP